MTPPLTSRYGIFVHDPDGDMSEGMIVGTFQNFDAAERRAEKIRNHGDATGNYTECIVLPVIHSRAISIRAIVDAVSDET